jgi:hypothetical protein
MDASTQCADTSFGRAGSRYEAPKATNIAAPEESEARLSRLPHGDGCILWTDSRAVGIIRAEDEDPCALERWFSEEADARRDARILAEIMRFVQKHEVKSVAMTDRIIGCPHEEGIDYPAGESCPKCPFWAGRDRFTHERIH